MAAGAAPRNEAWSITNGIDGEPGWTLLVEDTGDPVQLGHRLALVGGMPVVQAMTSGAAPVDRALSIGDSGLKVGLVVGLLRGWRRRPVDRRGSGRSGDVYPKGRPLHSADLGSTRRDIDLQRRSGCHRRPCPHGTDHRRRRCGPVAGRITTSNPRL